MERVIILIAEDRYVPQCLNSLGLSRDNDNRYIAQKDVGKFVRHSLSRLNIIAIENSKVDDKFREDFIQEYIELIGSIGKNQRRMLWWATDMASKNRFASKISDYLEEFILIMKSVECRSHDALLIINPSREIVPSLKQAFGKMRINCDIVHKIRLLMVLSGCKGFLRKVLSIPKTAIRLLIRRDYEQKKLRINLPSPNMDSNGAYIIKTFLYPSSFIGDDHYRDAFFGKLPDFIKPTENVILFGTIFSDFTTLIKKISGCKTHTIIPVEYFLTFSDICEAIFKRLVCRFDLNGIKRFFGYDVSSILSNELRNTFNGIQFEQLLYYWATKRLLQNIRINTFLMTYENNPWERMCTLAVREHSPGSTVIGYQHTVVPQASANMFPSRNEHTSAPIPDKIYTVGDEPKRIMEHYGHYPERIVESGCALRFDYLFEQSKVKEKVSNKILVVLEGIFDVYKMVNYIADQLHDESGYEIRIRSHPVLPFTAIANRLTMNINDIPHFELSRNISLKSDLQWGDIIVYWGTTVALEALKLGKPVIRYDMGRLLSYDPLFRCSHLKWEVDDSVSLKDVIEEIRALDATQLLEARTKAKSYLDSYFIPVSRQSLEKFVQHQIH